VRRFRKLVPSVFLAASPVKRPLVHLFDEPQFNTQDGYIGFMLDFFRKIRAEGRLVFLCLHPTASYHLEILNEIAERFLFVAGGTVTQVPNFQALISDPRMQTYLGPRMTRQAKALV
jgi:ABC-type ATPase involved in cell division